MNRLLFAILLAAVLSTTACSSPANETPPPASSSGSPQTDSPIPVHLLAARDFALALFVSDGDTLLTLIPPVENALATEIRTLAGPSISGIECEQEWNGRVLIIRLPGADELKVLGEPEDVIASSDDWVGSMRLKLIEDGDDWLVARVNDRESSMRVARESASGQACAASMRVIWSATQLANADRGDYTHVGNPAELAPDYLAAVPTCPSGGDYSLEEIDTVVCSVHGKL